MRGAAGSIALLLALLLAGACAGANDAAPGGSMQTVAHVDLERYLGRWYEIARIPNRFQKQCQRGTTADYSLREDGRITVRNRCLRADGSADEAMGLAKIVDRETNARLRVSFVSFLGWRPFWGDYWIIGLDPDYRWAVVGTPDRKYGWVLARTSTLPAADLAQVDEILRAAGYDPAAFAPSLP